MNLRGIANSNIQIVNENITIQWMQSTGSTTNAAGQVTPTYNTVSILAQIQALSAMDIKHTDALNLTGVMRSVYMYGNVQSLNRVDQQGGDILQFAETINGVVRNWLVSTVVEAWLTWAHVIVTLQAN